jgi:hypothetical protein
VIEDPFGCDIVRRVPPAKYTFEHPVAGEVTQQPCWLIIFFLPKQWKTHGDKQHQDGILQGFQSVHHPRLSLPERRTTEMEARIGSTQQVL